jgi:hypothetical protein
MSDKSNQLQILPLLKPLVCGWILVLFFYIAFTFAILIMQWSIQVKPNREGVRDKAIALTGQFGDTYGMLNALFSGFAFVAVIVSLNLQRHDLQASLEEFQHSVKAQTDLAIEAKKQSEIQENLMKSQLLRDRHEMYWRGYQSVSAEHVALFKLFPDDYMDKELYNQKYINNDIMISKFIYFSRLYENLAFSYMNKQNNIPDLFGENWMLKYCNLIVTDDVFIDVHKMFTGFYPDFENYINTVLRKIT